MLEWDDARYLLAVHRAGSLSEAGRKLGVNQSTVGRRLATLEAALGARMFHRTRDGYVLAVAGQRVLRHAESMEEQAHAIEREVLGQEARLTGLVRLTGPDAFSARIVMPILGRFRERYPDIDLELLADNRNLNLTKREADLAVRTGRPKEPQVVSRRVTDFAAAPYASQAYLAQRGVPRAGHFKGHDIVGFDEGLGRIEEAQWLTKHARHGRVVFRSASTPVQLAATLAGMGIAVLPCYLGDRESTLVRLGTEGDRILKAVWIGMHKDLQHATRIRACVDFLATEIRAQASLLAGRRKAAPRR